MRKLLVVIIFIFWNIIGMIGGMRARENRVNIEMIIFVCCAPFLAFLELLL